jgi:hypothetical protein
LAQRTPVRRSSSGGSPTSRLEGSFNHSNACLNDSTIIIVYPYA